MARRYQRAPDILAANAEDVTAAEAPALNAAFVDRLLLDDKRVAAMASGLDVVRDLPDPVGVPTLGGPNGMKTKGVPCRSASSA